MNEALLNAQSTALTRAAPEVGSSFDDETLEDMGHKAALYIVDPDITQDKFYDLLGDGFVM